MRFNNFLNRLRLPGIITLFSTVALVIVITLSLLLRLLFHVEPPLSVLQNYASALRRQEFTTAQKYLADNEEHWNVVFKTYAKDESSQTALLFLFWKNATLEYISTSVTGENQVNLRVRVNAPDAKAILQAVRTEAESGKIDLSDTSLVRLGKNQTTTLLNYAADHFRDYADLRSSEDLIITFTAQKHFPKKNWLLSPTQDLHQAMGGRLEEAIRTVFSKPLVLPKS